MISRNSPGDKLPALHLWRGVAAAFSLLTVREKIAGVFLVASMNLNAVLNIAGLAGVVPFVQLMLDPAPFSGEGLTARALRWFDITSIDFAITAVGAAILVLLVAKNAYSLLHMHLVASFSAAIETRLARETLSSIMDAPYAWLVERNASVLRDIVLGDVVEASRGVVRSGLQMLNDLIFLGLALGLLIAANPIPGLTVSTATAMLALGILLFVRPRLARLSESKRVGIRFAGITASEAIAGGRDVRMSPIAPLLLSDFHRDYAQYAKADAQARQWQAVPRIAIEVIGIGAIVASAAFALSSGIDRVTVAGLLALYSVVAIRAIPVVSQISTSVNQIFSALPAVAALREIRQSIAAAGSETAAAAAEPFPAWRALALEDVGVRYAGAHRMAVERINLAVQLGRSIGIVGGSGAGKSTLVDVIAGLLVPTQGAVLVDGRPLTRDSRAAWRASVSYVAQTPFLLDATIADNIRFGTRPDGDDTDRLTRAVAVAGLSSLIAELPDRESTMVGERGARLSGGQRQRIAIARAVYREASLVILDEATSALDSLTERDIADAIYALVGQTTLIIIAHRLSTVTRCDEIVVLDRGHFVARGTHAELLDSCPVYSQMVEAQTL
jgi:ABC-type multidrug transport system fused ATPase/permease subunit